MLIYCFSSYVPLSSLSFQAVCHHMSSLHLEHSQNHSGNYAVYYSRTTFKKSHSYTKKIWQSWGGKKEGWDMSLIALQAKHIWCPLMPCQQKITWLEREVVEHCQGRQDCKQPWQRCLCPLEWHRNGRGMRTWRSLWANKPMMKQGYQGWDESQVDWGRETKDMDNQWLNGLAASHPPGRCKHHRFVG